MGRPKEACKILNIGLNGPMPNRVKVWRNIKGVTIEANNFAFKVKALLGFESPHTDGLMAKIGLNGPND